MPVGRAAKVAVPAGVAATERGRSRIDRRASRRAGRGEALPDRRCSAGSGCCSRSSPAAAHFVGLVGRGMAADPNRVPWGNMYEFTITGAFVVVVRLPAAAQALRPVVDGPDRHGHRGRPADGGGALALRPGRAADRGAAVVLAGDPRGVGDHRDRRVHPRRHHLGALPDQGAVAGARQGRPTAATSPGCPRCRRSTGCPTGSTPSASRSGPSRC